MVSRKQLTSYIAAYIEPAVAPKQIKNLFYCVAVGSLLSSLCLSVASNQGLTTPLSPYDGLDLPVSPPSSQQPSAKPLSEEEPSKKGVIPPEEELPKTPPEETSFHRKRTFFGTEIVLLAKTIFFVIDISGSMRYYLGTFEDEDGNTIFGTRLHRAKIELKKFIISLTPEYNFNILAYDCGSIVLFDKLKEATDDNKNEAKKWIDELKPHGGTGTGPAVKNALGMDRKNKTVVLLSDGVPNCIKWSTNKSGKTILVSAPESEHAKMIRKSNLQKAQIFTFGIAVSPQSDAEKFMMEVASESSALYTPVPF